MRRLGITIGTSFGTCNRVRGSTWSSWSWVKKIAAGFGSIENAVAAMREGATDFIEKPYVDVAVLKQVQKHGLPEAYLEERGPATLIALGRFAEPTARAWT